jgi:hypothetical protein
MLGADLIRGDHLACLLRGGGGGRWLGGHASTVWLRARVINVIIIIIIASRGAGGRGRE